jgi:hypothetical protein
MNTIHQTIFDLGIEQARKQAVTPFERQVIDTAYAVMTDEDQQFGVIHAGFAMSSLPHKETKEHLWMRESGTGVKLRVASGLDENNKPIGLPFGATARMILLYLQSSAVAQRTREIELGKSMYSWLNKMGIPLGGNTYARVREQAKRLSYCQLTFFKIGSDETQLRNGSFVRDAILTHSSKGTLGQGSLWRDTVVLDETFYQSLIEHPLPVREAAICSLSGRSVAIDVYIWLSYRLYQLSKPTPITWIALMAQFGHSYNNLKNFRAEFKATLQLALAAYEGAKVEITSAGIILYPSPPAVPLKSTVSPTARLLSSAVTAN